MGIYYRKPAFQRPTRRQWTVPSKAASSTAYTLDCDPGSYAVSGTAATFPVALSLTCAPGTYAISGTAATFPVTLSLDCGIGSYVITGTAATLTYHAFGAGVAYGINDLTTMWMFYERDVIQPLPGYTNEDWRAYLNTVRGLTGENDDLNTAVYVDLKV